MTVQIGDRIPSSTLTRATDDGPKPVSTDEIFAGKTVALFAVPGAFTPTCSAKHLPGYIEHADALKAAKVDEIWCVSVNDAFVMGAWGREQGAASKVRMIADGSGEWTRALGLELDLTARGLGVRSQRYSMLLEDGVVKSLNIEEAGKYEVSTPEKMLEQARR